MENKSQYPNVLNFIKTNENAIIPTRATSGSAGFDLYACIRNDIILNPGKSDFVPCGIAIELPSENLVALIFARSGLAVKHGIALSNGVGVIDSDYRGEIGVGLRNMSEKSYTIKPGDRIAQMVILPVLLPTLKMVDSLGDTNRGIGGFGSTGK